MRKLKPFGLILMAALAMGAVAVPSASAEIFAFKSAVATTTLKGEQEGSGKIKVEAGTVTCEKTKFSGSMPAEYEFEVTMTPTYESCSMGEGTTEVVTTGCDYLFTANEKEGTSYEAEARIKCEAGKSITIVKKLLGVTKCTITIGAQEGLKTVTAAETGSPSALRTSIAFSGLKYTQTAGTGLGACTTAENKTNGTYEGAVVVKGFSGETQVKVQEQALPQSIDISKNPIKLAGKNSTTTFDITSKAAEALTITNLIIDGTVTHMAKCINQPLAKIGDKCTEEIKCVNPLGEKPWLGVVVGPPGGARVRLEGC